MTTSANPDLQPWVEPEIDVLDVEDTQNLAGVGRDAGAYASSQRS